MSTEAEVIAKSVLEYFEGLGGFDEWWDSLKPRMKEQILRDLAELLSP